jgi:ribonuclease D
MCFIRKQMKRIRLNKPVMTKHYNGSLTEDEVKSLPLLQFDGKVTLIDNMDTFYQVIDNIGKSSIVGFDTETKPSFRKGRRNTVSLLQLADDRNAWLFRLNMIGLPPELAAILADENLHKVGVAIHDDIKALRSVSPFEPGGFVDLQGIVAGHGIKQLGLKKLSAIVLGYRISKSQQVSNWEASALTESQQLYAATDAWICRRIYLALNGRQDR